MVGHFGETKPHGKLADLEKVIRHSHQRMSNAPHPIKMCYLQACVVISTITEGRFHFWKMLWLPKLFYFSYLSRASWYLGHAMWKHATGSALSLVFMFVSGVFTLCLLCLRMEIDRGWSFAQERLSWRFGAVTAGVSDCKNRTDTL